MFINRIPDDIIGEIFTQNDANEFDGPFGKQSLKSFLEENPAYYRKLIAENAVSYIMFLDSSKRNCLRVEEALIKAEWSE